MAAAMYMVVYAPKLVMTPARMIGPTMEPMRPQDVARPLPVVRMDVS